MNTIKTLPATLNLHQDFVLLHTLTGVSKGRGQRAVGVSYTTHLLVHRTGTHLGRSPPPRGRRNAELGGPRSCMEQAAPHRGPQPHRFETEWLTHPVLAPTLLRQMQTSKAKFKLQTEVTRVLVLQFKFPGTSGAPWEHG